MIGELTNHLWQSTLFAVAAGLLVIVCRKNRAQVRYWLWLSASLKFLIPFSLLVSFTSHAGWSATPTKISTQTVPLTVVQIAQPFPKTLSLATAPRGTTHLFPFAIFGLWACGFGAIALIRFKAWLRIRAAVRSSSHLDIPAMIEVRSSPGLLEPGVVGLLRPILLLPAGITERLTKSQLDAVFTHELCHVRRRDNLTAAIHMVVEALLWFYPPVWWIGARLVEERERACDEDVLQRGSEPHVYAQGILKVCELYVESPLTCMAGVTGKNLKKRMERIMRNHVGESLNIWRKVLLFTAGLMAATLPILIGLFDSPQSQAASGAPTGFAEGEKQAFETSSVTQNETASETSSMNVPLGPGAIYDPNGGVFSATNVPLVSYIYFAYNLSGAQFEQLLPHLPSWVIKDRFDIQAKASGNPTKDQMRLMMQSLLADRFKLSVRYETQDLPVLALVSATPGKMGPQLQEHLDNPPCSNTGQASGPSTSTLSNGLPVVCGDLIGLPSTNSGRTKVGARKVSMALLASWLPQIGNFGRTVVDKTGLSGSYDFNFEWGPLASNPQQPPQEPEAGFLKDLKDQLGVKLESQTGPVKVFIIDHIEKPSTD
jgi:bla regulator protein BlaR1